MHCRDSCCGLACGFARNSERISLSVITAELKSAVNTFYERKIALCDGIKIVRTCGRYQAAAFREQADEREHETDCEQ